MTGYRGKILIVLLLVIWTLSIVPSISSQGLTDKFQIERPKSHHIILLDTSGSMKPYFNQVLEAVQILIQSLPPEDILTLFRFDDYPVRLCSGSIKTLNLIEYLPKEVNADPKSKTEIGETFEKALEEIGTSQSSIFIIFFLTDGKEEPRQGSKFYHKHDESWVALVEIARKLSIQKEICGYGLGLKQYTDVNLLGRIVPQRNVEVITIKNPSELRSRIESLREKVRRNWLRLAVESEIKAGFLDLIQVQGPRIEKGKINVAYAIKSNYPHLDVSPIPIAVSNSALNLKLNLEAPVSIVKMGQSQPLPISFEIPPHSLWLLGKKTIAREEKLAFKASPAFVDEKEINSLGIKAEVKIKGFEKVIPYSYRVGIPFSFIGILALSLLAFIIMGVRWMATQTPMVFGTLTAEGVGQIDLALRRSKRIRIGGVGQDIELPGVAGGFETEVRKQGSYHTLFIKPFMGEIQMEGRILSTYSEEELQENMVKLTVNGKELILTDVSPRKESSKRWSKVLLFLVCLVILNYLVWVAGP